jgi:hypothetical protein
VQPRWGTPRDERYPTFGGQVAEVARSLRLPLTPWQRHVADVALEYEVVEIPVMQEGVLIYTVKAPRLRYREVRLWVPRQSGKTVLLVALLTWRCMFGDETFYPDEDFMGRRAQWVTFFSTHGGHAKHKFEDEFQPLLAAVPELEGEYVARNQNGHEAFMWSNDSLWQLGSSSEKAAHGDAGDVVAADEFFAQVDNRIENGARATMITRRSPQIWFVSTFGDVKPDVKEGASAMSEPLWAKVDDSRRRCRTGHHGPVATFEYSAADEDDPSIDPSDHALWIRTMPGLQQNGGIIPIEAVQDDFDSMSTTPGGLLAFKRAYLNLRQPRKDRSVPSAIKPGRWASIIDEQSQPAPRAKLALGLEVDPEGRESALVIAGERTDRRRHIELTHTLENVEETVAQVAVMLIKHDITDVAVDASGPSVRFLPELRELKRKLKFHLHEYTGKQTAAACESFRAAATIGRLAERGSPRLAECVREGIKRQIGDLWVWDKRTPEASIAPLGAATVAHRALEEAILKRSRRSAYEEEGDEFDTEPEREQTA